MASGMIVGAALCRAAGDPGRSCLGFAPRVVLRNTGHPAIADRRKVVAFLLVTVWRSLPTAIAAGGGGSWAGGERECEAGGQRRERQGAESRADRHVVLLVSRGAGLAPSYPVGSSSAPKGSTTRS